MIVWHYTLYETLGQIVASGEIVPAVKNVGPNERPAVWFSRRSTWEPTATKGWGNASGVTRDATIEEMTESGPLVRIGIDDAGLHTWIEHRKIGGISASEAKHLVQRAMRLGSNPGDWLVTYESVPSSRWVAVETWDGERWAREARATG